MWVRLGDLLTIVSGVSYNKNDVGGKGIRILRGGNIQDNKILLEDSDVFLPQSYEDVDKSIKKDDIVIVASTGSKAVIGKTGFAYEDMPNIQIGAFLRIIRLFSPDIAPYLRLIFSSGYYRQHIRKAVLGTNINNIKNEYITDLYIPLPPIAEQHRIANRLKNLEPLIIRYRMAAEELARLKAAFPENLRKSILQCAIQGKLVSQNPEDEPAEILLSKIQEEKKKLIKEGKLKPSKLPKLNEPINSADTPFKIPNSWVLVSLGEIINLVSGQDMPPEKYNNRKIGIPYITGASNIEGEQVLINRWTSEPKSKSYKGDLLLTCKGTVGAMAFLKEDTVHIARQIMALRGNRYLNLKYIKIYLQTYIPTLQAMAKSLIPGIDRKSLLGIQIPLPPLAEQKRIVEKVEELNLFVNKLSSLIT